MVEHNGLDGENNIQNPAPGSPPNDPRMLPLWTSLKKSKLLPSQQQKLLDNYAYLLAAEDTNIKNTDQNADMYHGVISNMATCIGKLVDQLDNIKQETEPQTYYQSAKNIVLGSEERKRQDEILAYLNTSLRECSLIINTAFTSMDPESRLDKINEAYNSIRTDRAEDEKRIRTLLRHYHVHVSIIVTLEIIAAIVDLGAFVIATKLGLPVVAFALTEAYGLLSLTIVALAPHLLKKTDGLKINKVEMQDAIMKFKEAITTQTIDDMEKKEVENEVTEDEGKNKGPVSVDNAIKNRLINRNKFSTLDDKQFNKLKSAYEELLRAVFTHEKGPARTEALFVYNFSEQILDNEAVNKLLRDEKTQKNAVDYIEQLLKDTTAIIEGKMTNYEKLSNSMAGMFVAACFSAAIYTIVRRPAISAGLLAAGLLAGWVHGLMNKSLTLLISDPETRKVIEELPGRLFSSSEKNIINSNIDIKDVQSNFKQRIRSLKAQGTQDSKTSDSKVLHQAQGDPDNKISESNPNSTNAFKAQLNAQKGERSKSFDDNNDKKPVPPTSRSNSFG